MIRKTLVLGAALLGAACANPPGATGPGENGTPGTAEKTMERDSRPRKAGKTPDTTETGIEPGVPDTLIGSVIDDVVARTGVQRDGVRVVRAQAITWNDGSLGCPEPGMSYTQAIVEGHWLVLEADGHSFDYRAGRRGSFRLCENPPPGPPRGRRPGTGHGLT